MISFDSVSLRYDTGISMRDLNFQIKNDEFVYLFGESGSGKSSILKMIYMELFPNAGSVKVFEQESTHIKRGQIAALRQRVSMVFQDFKLLGDRDIYSNISLPLELQGLNPDVIRRKVAGHADDLGIRSRLSHYPHELSAGEQQKVALARALIVDPDILLADEPTAFLDESSAQEVLKCIWRLHTNKTCVLFATHNETLIKQEPARTLSLASGELLQDRPA